MIKFLLQCAVVNLAIAYGIHNIKKDLVQTYQNMAVIRWL